VVVVYLWLSSSINLVLLASACRHDNNYTSFTQQQVHNSNVVLVSVIKWRHIIVYYLLTKVSVASVKRRRRRLVVGVVAVRKNLRLCVCVFVSDPKHKFYCCSSFIIHGKYN